LAADITDDPKPIPGAPTKSGWQQHAQQQRQNWLQKTPAERLAWIEEAIRFANRHRQER